MQKLLEELIAKNKTWAKLGSPASSIPILAKTNPNLFGLSIKTLEGKTFNAGDYNIPFTLQSISKPLALLLALIDNSERVIFENVGTEPTGELFDSIEKLETLRRPLNPMINAGAIATTSLIRGKSNEEKLNRLLKLISLLTSNSSVKVDEKVYSSEKEAADKNRSIAYFLRNIGVIRGDVETILELYFKQCSIMTNCLDLARIGAKLASSTNHPTANTSLNLGEYVIPSRYLKITNTLMYTCGFYNESGNLAIKAGIPSKSAISGGIMAVVPGKCGIGIYSPPLNDKGNSLAGIKILKDLSKNLELSLI